MNYLVKEFEDLLPFEMEVLMGMYNRQKEKENEEQQARDRKMKDKYRIPNIPKVRYRK